MLQSSLAIAQEIDARGVAKSAKNVFHYNTQKLLGEKNEAANLPKTCFAATHRDAEITILFGNATPNNAVQTRGI